MHYEGFIARCRDLDPMRTAVVHPCDGPSIAAAVQAGKLGLIVPVLVGNRESITAAARAESVDLAGCEFVEATDSKHAAARAVELARTGAVVALMKGSLHSDELLHEVARPDSGLHTQRRISHMYVMDVPNRPEPLCITDAVVNIHPNLDEKRDIIQNAIDAARKLGIAQVRVAVLSAIETVNEKIPETVEAAALCKMADRGQITGAFVDGPLAFDDALDPGAAQEKGIASRVAGYANVLAVPDFESGNMLAKALIMLAGASAAGVVLGARVPIALTSRADSISIRVASLAVARLLEETMKEREKVPS